MLPNGFEHFVAAKQKAVGPDHLFQDGNVDHREMRNPIGANGISEHYS